MKRILMTAVVVLLGMAAPARAQNVDAPRAQAQKSLDDLRRSASPEQHRALGFAKGEEAQPATLDTGIPAYLIRLDQLREYRGEDPGRLLVDLQTRVFQVSVAGQPRSTVEVHAGRDGWETVRIGGAAKSRLVHEGQRQAMKASGMSGSDFFEVRIPALNMLFLGHHDGEGLKLTPLLDNASLELKAGRPEAAEKVLARLVPLAREVPDSQP